MAVVMVHFSATAQADCSVWMPSLVPHGYLAVDFFFILSGFIMSYTYLDAFQSQGLWAFPEFLRRRAARIVPLNVAVLLALIIVAHLSMAFVGQNIFYATKDSISDFLANVFMLQGLGIGHNLNGPSWSISTEFAAYFLFPLFVLAVFDGRPHRWVLDLATCIGILYWVASSHPRLSLATTTVSGGVLRCFAEFVMGMYANRFYRARRWEPFLRSDWTALALALFCVTMLLLRWDLPAVLSFPFIVVAFSRNEGWAAKLLSSGVPYFLGTISYSIYLIHNAFRPVELGILRAVHPAQLSLVPALAFGLFGSVSVIPFAWVTYRCVEKPGRELVRHLSPVRAV